MVGMPAFHDAYRHVGFRYISLYCISDFRNCGNYGIICRRLLRNEMGPKIMNDRIVGGVSL